LKAIQEHAMDYQATKYEMSIIIDALKAMMTTKQTETLHKISNVYHERCFESDDDHKAK